MTAMTRAVELLDKKEEAPRGADPLVVRPLSILILIIISIIISISGVV